MCTYILCLKQTPVPASTPTASCLLLLPWCTVITGYQINSDNSNSQQQPTTGNKQTNRYQIAITNIVKPPKVIATYTCKNSSMLSLCLLFMAKQWIRSNMWWLYRWCSLLPVEKKVSHKICWNPSEFLSHNYTTYMPIV